MDVNMDVTGQSSRKDESSQNPAEPRLHPFSSSTSTPATRFIHDNEGKRSSVVHGHFYNSEYRVVPHTCHLFSALSFYQKYSKQLLCTVYFFDTGFVDDFDFSDLKKN